MWHWLLLTVAIAVASVLFYAFLPVGVDFYYQFWPIPRRWLLEGQPLYTSRAGFYNPPWTVLLLLPFSLLPIQWGMVALTFFSLGVLLWTVRVFSVTRTVSLLLVLAAVCNLHTFDLLVRGQIDAFVLLGVALGFWAVEKHKPWRLSMALVLLTVKPVNVALPALVILWPILRWTARDLVKVATLPLLAFISSFPLFGWDWPARWWASYQAFPPRQAWVSTLWRALESLHLPLWPGAVLSLFALGFLVWIARRVGSNRQSVATAQATNLAITPYSLSYHYVLIMGISLPEISATSRVAVLALWILTFLPLARVWIPATYWWLDILFPIAAWVTLVASSVWSRADLPAAVQTQS
jgi:hypothetical protein